MFWTPNFILKDQNNLEGKAQPAGSLHNNQPVALEKFQHKGYLLIRDLWNIWTDSIHDMFVVNTEALYHWNKSTEKCLQAK